MHDDRNVRRRHHSDLEQLPGSIWSDEHDEPFVEVFYEDGLVECVKDVVITNSVPAGTLDDDRIAIHINKLACVSGLCKVPC